MTEPSISGTNQPRLTNFIFILILFINIVGIRVSDFASLYYDDVDNPELGIALIYADNPEWGQWEYQVRFKMSLNPIPVLCYQIDSHYRCIYVSSRVCSYQANG